jgi:protein TonB
LSDLRIVKSLHPLFDKEALRVLSLMPNWIPGKQNGESVKVKYTIPIAFRLEADTDSTKINKQ